jgi:type IV pilus assembly protein PilE
VDLPPCRPRPRAGAGFTLVEIAVVLTVAALLLTLAVPRGIDMLSKARRADAVAALTRVQVAQESYRAHHGVYAADRRALGAAAMARSESGHYDIVLQDVMPQSYRAEAHARADGPQSRDASCLQLTLQVDDGQARAGPSPACWNR